MDSAHIKALLTGAGAKEGEGGFWEVADGKAITLYAATNGVALPIPRGIALRHDGALTQIRTAKGELFVVRTDDLFAGAIEGSGPTARKAGFI